MKDLRIQFEKHARAIVVTVKPFENNEEDVVVVLKHGHEVWNVSAVSLVGSRTSRCSAIEAHDIGHAFKHASRIAGALDRILKPNAVVGEKDVANAFRKIRNEYAEIYLG